MFKPLLFTLALFLLLTVPATAHGSFVYVTNYGDGTISQFQANSNGTLTALNPPAVKAWPRCHSLAADPSGRFLYVLSSLHWSRRNCCVSQFRIQANGKLTPLSPPTVPTPDTGNASPLLITAEPSGRFVYVPGRDGFVAEYRIQKNGSLKTLMPSSVQLPSAPGDDCHVAYDRLHNLVYVSTYGHMMSGAYGGRQALHIRRNGQLLVLPNSRTHDLSEGIFVTQSGRYAYIPSYYRDSEAPKIKVSEYRTDSDGRYVPLIPSRISVPLNPPQVGLPLNAKTLLIGPHDRFCYLISPSIHWEDAGTYNRRFVDSLSVAHCVIRPSGQLGRPVWQTFSVRSDIWEAVTDPSGRALYLLTDNGVRPFRVNVNGSVSIVGTKSIRTGYGPHGVTCVSR